MDREKNIFDSIGVLIPGYKGYAERNGRRQCDRILRDFISFKLNSCEKKISNKIKEVIKSDDNSELFNLENIRKKTNIINSRIKYAPYGESSFFGSSQLKENELLTIYQMDLNILNNVESIENNLLNCSFEKLDENLDNIGNLIDERNNYIKEYK